MTDTTTIIKHLWKKSKPRPNFMIRLSHDDISKMAHYAIEKGYNLSAGYAKYSTDEQIHYPYKTTLKLVRYAIKRKYPLPYGQTLAGRKQRQKIGITIIHANVTTRD